MDVYLNRWLQPDSIIPDPENVLDWDRYSYVRNNPVNMVDPSGHQAVCYWMGYSGISCATYNSSYSTNYQTSTASSLPAPYWQTPSGVISPSYSNYYSNYGAASYIPASTGYFTSSGSYSASEIQAQMANNSNVGRTSNETDGGGFGDPNPGLDPKWKPGDPINTKTKNGYPSWSTAQKRYWMNRALNALPDEFSPENLKRMQNGDPPLHDVYNVSMELHHINGRTGPDPHNVNNLIEVWPWEHSAMDPHRYYTGPKPE